MPRVLVAAAKSDFGPKLNKAVDAVRAQVAGRAEVVSAADVNWEQIKMIEGSWDAAYAWAARSFDGIVLIPTVGNALSRGVYEMGRLFLDKGKRVALFTGIGTSPVSALLPGANDWKQNYGVAQLG